MGTLNYPSSGSLIFTFLENVKRYRVNRLNGNNPILINFNGEQMYVYIKNLSPAQLSNDNPDVWRIQLPKKDEFDTIKKGDKLFVLLGYDYQRKVYTTWNPYWCKQRLNVAESCSMYSRLSLQKRVADKQKIEVMQLQNDGNVVCIPSALLGNYLNNIKEYYPEETTYIPVGSSIQKRKNEELQNDLFSDKSDSELLFEKFKSCLNKEEFRVFLLGKGYQNTTINSYLTRLDFVFENGFIRKHEDLFLECKKIEDYKRAINRFCWQPDVRYYEDIWNKGISASLKHFLMFAELKLYGTHSIRYRELDEMEANEDEKSLDNKKFKTPLFKLDQFGKLVKLDAYIIDELTPLVRGVDYPDYESIIKKIKDYYPSQATEKMTPADWIKLFDSTKWVKKRGRKAFDENENKVVIAPYENNEIKEEIINVQDEIPGNLVDYTENNTDPSPISINRKLLETVFDKKVTSYKYFWFVSVISLANSRVKLSISYDEILIRMAALAWPIVLQDSIVLGERDMLFKILKDLQKSTYIISAASSKIVEATLTDYYNVLKLKETLSPLLNNVPYRFLSPWVKFTNNDEVIEASQVDTFEGPYALKSDGIVIKTEWKDYFSAHYDELCDFAFRSFINYTKQFNNDLRLVRLIKRGWGLK